MTSAVHKSASSTAQPAHTVRLCFLLLRDGLSDLGVSDLLADGGRLHLLQGTHDAVLLAPVGLYQWVHAVRVEHNVVGRHQQHPTNCALKAAQKIKGKKRGGWGDPSHPFFIHQRKHLACYPAWKIIKKHSAIQTTRGRIHFRPQMS